MAATEEIRGVGHSVKRVEDARFIRGKGTYFDDITLPGMLHLEFLRSPLAHARIKSIDASRAQELPGVVAVVTGELLAQHNLAWMPTLSGDTQAVLATDKVRFQGQEVAAVVAESAYIAKDACELIEVDYEELQAVTSPQQALAEGAPVIRDEKEGQTDNHIYDWEAGDKEATDTRLRRGRPRRRARHLLPALPPVAARVLRLRRRRQPGDGEGDDLHDLAGPARAQDALRDRGGPPRAQDPHRLARPGRRLREQGARSTPATSARPRPRSSSAGR